MALVLEVDGSRRPVEPASPPSFTLEELQGLVSGYIELVSLGDGSLLVINEEGKLQGFAYNEQATARARGYLFAGDYIAGPAVVVSEQELGE